MLPDFPKPKQRREKLLMKRAMRESQARHGVLREISRFVQHEGRGWDSGTVHGDRETIRAKEFSGVMSFHRDEWPALSDDKLVAKYRTAFDPMADQQMDMFLGVIERATTQSGNVVKANGELTPEHILQMLDRMELSFSDDGAQQDSLLMSPAMAEHFQQMEFSDDFLRRHAEIVERKRADWRLRQIDRKLVD